MQNFVIIHVRNVVTKNSHHGPCQKCVVKQKPTEREDTLIQETKDREEILRRSPKVMSVESISECEWMEQMTTDPSVRRFLKNFKCTFNSSKQSYVNEKELFDDIINGRLSCFAYLSVSVKKAYRFLSFFCIGLFK